jgi:acyl CoA:acetate/3-ketoacid CoA transferase beta subunit
MLTREQIAKRAARELQNGESVFLDPTWAVELRAGLPAGVTVREASPPEAPVDVAIVAATTVSLLGELGGTTFTGAANKVVALIEQHQGDDGSQHVLKESAPSALKAKLVITNLAVFDVTSDGLVMREVAQGVSALDVQLKSEANLLAADDLRVIVHD